MSSKDLFFDVQQGKFVNKNKKSDKPTAILYLRVSTEEQSKHGNGIDSQASSCKMYAMNNGIEIIKQFSDEGISGRVENRPGLNQALDFLKEKKKKGEQIDYFICSELSRISRNQDLSKTLSIEKQIEETGTTIITPNKSIKDAEDRDANSMLSDDMTRMFAKHEAIIGSERTKNGMKNSLLNGGRPFGSTPVGYKKEKNPNGRDPIKKDKPNCDILKEGLEMFSTGKLEDHNSLYLFFLEKGLKSNHYKQERKLNRSIISRILTVEKLLFYAGYVVYPKRGIDEPVKGAHENIIDLNTAYKIIEKINKTKIDVDPPEPKTRKDFDKNLFLRGILYCPDCGEKYTGGYCSGRNKKYPYYRCKNPKCESRKVSYVNTSNAHQELRKYLESFSVDKEILDNIEEIFNECWERQKENHKNKDIEAKKSKIKEIKDKQEKIGERIIEVENSDMIKQLESKRAELEKEKNNLEQELEKKEFNKENYIKILNEFKDILENPAKVLDIEDAKLSQFLIAVQTNEKLVYKKNQGFGTPDFSVLKLIHSTFGDQNF